MNKTVVEVTLGFLRRERLWSNSLTSDGTRLLSYGLVIGLWGGSGKRIIITLPLESGRECRTTSKHRALLRSLALLQGTEVLGNSSDGTHSGNHTKSSKSKS